MTIETNDSLLSRFKSFLPGSSRLVQGFGVATLALGGSALFGWYIGSARLTGFRADYIPMAPNTALSFLLLGLSLLLLHGKRRGNLIVAYASAVFIVLLSLVRGSEFVTSVNLNVDRLFFHFPGGKLGLAPIGHMALFTSIAFANAGTGLFLSALPKKRRSANDLAIIFSIIPTLIGLAFLLGYLYGAPLLYGGATIPMALNTTLAFVTAGAGLLIHNIAHEIAARRSAERALRQAYDQLEKRIQERTAELAAAHQVLERELAEKKKLEDQLLQSQKMEAIGQLAGGIAHDFNNLLTIITGYSELLLQTIQPENPQAAKVKEIQRAGERASALTRQLLAFSRRQVLQPKVLNLNDVVKGIQNMLRRLIGEHIEVSLSLAPMLKPVKADPSHLEQVIMNLAVNARDAMPQGGRLAFETANTDLDETYTRDHVGVQPGPYVMLAVSDSGCGMEKDTLSRIFEPFFTTKEEGKGTGLGLSVVYGIIKQSGGNIWVYSVLGQGTTFKIYLPAVLESVRTKDYKTHSSKSHRGSETVLLVEDEGAVRQLTREVLEHNGYKVVEAGSSQEAIEIYEATPEPIHLIVTDVIMPQMGGRELLERLAKSNPGMKVLYISGFPDDAVLQYGLLEKDTAFLQKPFTAVTLVQKVREILEKE